MKQDLHLHTTFSDGRDTPENMVLSALAMGFDTIGFSDHSFTPFDTSYCMQKEAVDAYFDEIDRLKLKYGDKIKIQGGLEQDIYSPAPSPRAEYLIGSVHYLNIDGVYIPVDENPEILTEAKEKYFNGDIFGIVDAYYKTMVKLPETHNINYIGHFDLISKFNQNDRLFESNSPTYRSIWQTAADKLLGYGLPFEINTGAISRGYRSEPYPTKPIYDYLRAEGACFILSSDAHSRSTLGYQFEKYQWMTQK